MTIANLAGIALDGTSDISWTQTVGTDPDSTVIKLERNRAQAIFDAAAGQPVTMQLGERKFERLYVTSMGPGGSPHTRTLIVKDERWLWQQTLIRASFNKRSRTPIRRLVGEGDPQNRPAVPTFLYKSYSLNNGQVWTLEEALKSVFDRLFAEHGTLVNIPTIRRDLPFEDFEETTDAASVLQRLIGYAAGYEIAPRDDGIFTITDTHDNSASIELGKTGPIAVGSGWIESSDRRYERPAWVDVYFLPECELRFDFIEGNFSTTPTRTDSDRLLTNVVKVSERNLKINGIEVAEGSYVDLNDYIAALNADRPNAIALSGPYIVTNYLRHWKIENDFIIDRSTCLPDLLWAERIKAILSSFRRQYALPSFWMDRLQSIKAKRVAIVDQATKTRANAEAYTQWTAWPSQRMHHQNSRSKSFKSGWFYDGYSTLLAQGRVARADINAVDPQAGIVRVYLQKDARSEAIKIVPGLPKSGLLASIVDTFGSGSAATAQVLLDGQVELAPNYKLALVLTGVKAASDRQGLYSVRVPFKIARDVGGLPDQPALGPPLSLFIAPGETTTARFAWDDSKSRAIEDFFIAPQGQPVELTSIDPKQTFGGDLGSLLVNSDAVAAIAMGAAASVYSRIVDRLEGGHASLQVKGGGGPQVSGAISEIRTVVTQGGVVAEQITLPRILKGIDPLASVPSAIRQRLLGLLETP